MVRGQGQVLFTKEGRVNTKTKRIQNYRKTMNEFSLSPAYTVNTTKEELCLEYVGSFIDQFMTIRPKRLVPYMIAENECGVSKFVCTSLRPTLIAIPELYDFYECASFLAGFVHYEPLDPPDAPPSVLPSPNLTLRDYTGDSFDLANLLCSFLLGAGYDAYMVNGYAPKHITLRDQTHVPAPLNLSDASSKSYQRSAEEQKRPELAEENPYKPIDNSIRKSSFIAAEEERRRLESLDPFLLWVPQEREIAVASEEFKRVHAWVLIRAGRRGMTENLFVEPTTGRAYPITGSPYLGIESLWNHLNYWVNLQPEKKLEETDFDLKNEAFWEYVFISTTASSKAGRSVQAGDTGDAFMSSEAVPETTDDSAIGENDIVFDCPPVWSDPLELDRTSYILRFPPTGRKTIQYYKSKVDFFAKNTQVQCVVMRATIYHDVEKVLVKEVHEWFENRRDKLYKRIRYYLGERRFVEFYHPGCVGEIKQWLEYPGKKREIDFYINGRLDRMYRREEIIGSKVTEYYEGRTDFMTLRSVTVTSDRATAGGRHMALPGGGLAPELFAMKITTVFDRNDSIAAEMDIAKRVYSIPEGKLTSQYHFIQGKITSMVKVFNHTRVGAAGGQSGADDEINEEDLDALQEAAALEREVFAQVKLSFQQMQTIIKHREEVEAHVVNEPTIFEVALNKVTLEDTKTEETKGAARSTDTAGADYLTPFLRHLKDSTRLTREEAMDVRQTCLDSLKARLIERANIIQSRLNDENQKLARKQEQFQRAQRDGEMSSDDYEKYCTEAMFRIHILEQRLVVHEETALKKFADLDAKLASDSRLKVLRG